MKIRIEMEIDLQTGNYDVRLQNLSHPGTDIDLTCLSKVVNRVLDNVAVKTVEEKPTALGVAAFAKANDIN